MGEIIFRYRRTSQIITYFILIHCLSVVLYIPSFVNATSSSRSMSVLFRLTAALRAAMTIRNPTLSSFFFSIARSPSLKIRLHLLRTTAEPSFVEVVRPIRFTIFFSGCDFASRFAAKSGKTYTASADVTALLPFEYAFEYR